MKSPRVVPLESADIKLYTSIICYPRLDEKELENWSYAQNSQYFIRKQIEAFEYPDMLQEP